MWILLFGFAIAQVELEFSPASDIKASPASLQLARNVLQKRLEIALKQKVFVTIKAGRLKVKVETNHEGLSDADLTMVIALSTTVGNVEFFDSSEYLEAGSPLPEKKVVILNNLDIARATVQTDTLGNLAIYLQLTPNGSQKLAAYSRGNIGHFLVIARDAIVLSSPKMQAEIADGIAVIQGSFTLEETSLLAAQLSGQLPFAFRWFLLE
jgi:preprotein translocase subunit SecD